MTPRRRKLPRRWLLIYHPYSGRRGKSEFTSGNRSIDRQVLENDRAALSGGLDDVDPHISRGVPLARMLDELSNQIGSGGAGPGDGAPNHLARCRARRVEPQPAAVGDDAVVLRIGEPHREVAGAPLVQLAPRRIGVTEHRVFDDLDEVGREGADRVEGCGGTVET